MSVLAAAFATLLPAAAKSVLLALAALCLARRRLGPATRHLVWSTALIGALCLPALSLVAPSIAVRAPGWSAISAETAAPAHLQPGGAARAELSLGESGSLLDAGAPETPGLPFAPWLAGAWLAGTLVLLARTGRAHLRAMILVQRSAPVSSPGLRAEAARLAMGRRVPHLRESRDVRAPVTYGFFRPSIVLPTWWAELDPALVRAILSHELAHVRRGDCATQLLAELACALYWFNPLVWIGARRMEEDREHACDDFVLHQGTPPLAYAELLVHAVRGSIPEAPRGAFVSMTDRAGLEGRIRRILATRPHPRFGAAQRAICRVLAMVGVAVVTLLAGARFEAHAQHALPPEPDLSGDTLATPASERVPTRGTDVPQLSSALLSGPDSSLARVLLAEARRPAKDEVDLVPERARWALAQARGGELVVPLLRQLRSGDWRVQAYAAWALGHSADARTVPLLLDVSESTNWRLRTMTIFSLDRLGDPRAMGRMLRALRDPAWQVRVGAVGFVGRVGGAEGRVHITPMLSDRHPVVRAAAAEHLR